MKILNKRRTLLLAVLLAGIVLRVLLIHFPRPGDDDTAVYAELGHNLLHHGVYGIADDDGISPSLFRLPGYPIFLALMQEIFGRAWYAAVLYFQAAVDLCGCVLLAAFARKWISQRGRDITFVIAVLCPFTAAYSAIALTESFSIFAVALAIYASGAVFFALNSGGTVPLRKLLLLASAPAMAMLLRPDGALLLLSVIGGLLWYGRGRGKSFQTAALCGLLAIVPLIPWTVRNWQVFHVVQPLAPRHVNDPGERVTLGFYRWMRTWSAEYVNTANVYWQVGSGKISMGSLPARAFDSPVQRARTAELLAEYNQTNNIPPELDENFAALAAERIHAHPLRYYLVLPLRRTTDMLLRPRTEAFYLKAEWWKFDAHPANSAISIALGLLNLAYVVLALVGLFSRDRRVPAAMMMVVYLVLRCLLLGGMENAEPRYTLECYPIFMVAAAAAVSGRQRAGRQRDAAAASPVAAGGTQRAF